MENAVGREHAELRRVDDAEALAAVACEEFAKTVEEAVRDRGLAFVVLSGGSTPRRFYETLATSGQRDSIPWNDIEFFWGDERAVPPDHPDSNFGMARDALLAKVASPMQLHRMEAERLDRDEAAREYETEIRSTLGTPPGGAPARFDLIVLGLGADGHTASLFPGSPALTERERWVVAAPGPRPDSPRMTMTLPILNRGRRVMFLVSGGDKAAVLREVLEGPADPVEAATFPARLVRPAAGALLWLVDRAAASELPNPAER